MSGHETARTLLTSIAYNILEERKGVLRFPPVPPREKRDGTCHLLIAESARGNWPPLWFMRREVRGKLAATQYLIWASHAGRVEAAQIAQNCIETALEASR